MPGPLNEDTTANSCRGVSSRATTARFSVKSIGQVTNERPLFDGRHDRFLPSREGSRLSPTSARSYRTLLTQGQQLLLGGGDVPF